MPNEQRSIETPMAVVVLAADGLVEVHIRENTRIDVEGIRSSLAARRTLLDGGRGALFFIAPGDPDWEPALLQTDLFGEDASSITVMGVLVSNKVLALAANTYFGLFPAAFPIRIDNNEGAIRAWLAGT